MRRFGMFFLLVNPGLFGCAAAPRPIEPILAPVSPAADVSYRVALAAPGSLTVTMHASARAAAKGLRLPVDWDGRGDLDRNITIEQVRVGGQIASHRIERWTLKADGLGDWDVRYLVTTRNQQNEETEGFPLFGDRYALAMGHTIFLYPAAYSESGEGRYEVRIAAPSGWPVHTTWDSANIDGLTALRDGVIAAGDWRVHRAEESALVLLLHGQFAWPDEALLGPLASLVTETRRFFGESATPRTTFILSQWPSERTTIAHTVRGGVLLTVGPDFDPNDSDSLSLLAHELFHLWVGAALRHGPDAVYAGLWFREGFAAYYGVLLPMRAGLVDQSHALERLQEAVVNAFLRHPVRDAKLYDLTQWYWWDRRIYEYVSKKGALTALLLDLELRQSGKSLDDFTRLLWQKYGRTGRRTSAADLARELSDYAAKDQRGFIDRVVLGIEPLPIAERLRTAGFDVQAAREEFPDFGLGWRNDQGVAVLENVRPDGAAHRAGCREGDAVTQYAVPEGRFDLEAAVTVRRSEREQVCRFFADRKLRDIWKLAATNERAQKLIQDLAH